MLTFELMPSNKPVRFIRPTQPLSDWFLQIYLRRETLWFFVWKDLKVQFENPILGFVWSIFQPLVYFGLILLAISVSGREVLANEMHFSVYLVCGLAIWNFCTSAILGSVNSIQSNRGLVSKTAFPRLYLILSPIIRSSFDLVILLLISVGMGCVFGSNLTLESLYLLPVAIGLAWFTTVGWASIAAAVIIWNRHARHVIPILLYAMIFALPVFYTIHQVNNQLIELVYMLNPIAGSMEFLRAALGGVHPTVTQLLTWFGSSIASATLGLLLIKRMEKTLADKV